nr:MAG TPA: hypothetical protein [Caudoviricetes sp.]
MRGSSTGTHTSISAREAMQDMTTTAATAA